MDTLLELTNFYEKITQYYNLVRQWANTPMHSNEAMAIEDNTQNLRAELQRDYGRIEKIIARYSGYRPTPDPLVGQKVDTFHIAFGKITGLNYQGKLNALDNIKEIVNKAIGKLQAEGKSWGVPAKKLRAKSEKPERVTKQPSKDIADKPKAFIAHGGESLPLRKLKSFLEALGVQPLIVEEQPSEGRSVGENVDYYARQADCAIILATKGDIDSKTGKFIPRGNVLIEIGKSQELFKERIIYLLQAGVSFPTNISEKVRTRFTSEKMDDAFIKITKELKKFGIL